MKTLRQDNSDKLSITATVNDIEYHAKMFFNWRTPTKHYGSILDRIYGLSSTNYDKFIKHMSELGY